MKTRRNEEATANRPVGVVGVADIFDVYIKEAVVNHGNGLRLLLFFELTEGRQIVTKLNVQGKAM